MTHSSDANGQANDPDRRANSAVQVTVLLWCLWLLGSWLVVRWQEASGQVDQWMLLAAATGLMAAWPTVRLSQERRPAGRLGTRPGMVAARLRRRWRLMEVAVEWLCLVLVFQAVLWPLSFVAGWGLGQTLWLNVAMVAWSSATAALVGWGCLFMRGLGRTVMLVLCLLLLVGEPAVVAVVATLWPGAAGAGIPGIPGGPGVPGAWGVSPLPTLWALSGSASEVTLDPWRWHATGMAMAALLAWVMLAAAARWVTPRVDVEGAG